jgi:hypothetical protein
MHDIKYFFLTKINQTIQRGDSKGDKLPKALSKSTIFKNPEEAGVHQIRPCLNAFT